MMYKTKVLKGDVIYKSPAEGYREVAFLRSDGNQYCDTDVVYADEIDCEWELETFSAYFGVYGNYVDEDTSCYRLIGQASDNNGIYFTANYAAKLSGGVTLSYRKFNRTRVTPSGIYVNDVLYPHSQTGGNSNSTTICVFGSRHAGSFKGYIKYLKMYHNNSLIRDYVPCERTSDGVLGLYDKVTNTFITNLGTGSFEKGDYITAEAPYKVLKSNGKFKVLLANEEYAPYWQQPVLTSDGVWDGDSFAVRCDAFQTDGSVEHRAFHAFDNDPNTQYQKNNIGSSSYRYSTRLDFYIPEGVKLQELEITNSEQPYNVEYYLIQATNGDYFDTPYGVELVPDTHLSPKPGVNETWTIPVNSNEVFKKFRLYTHSGTSTAVMIKEIKIKALKA